MDRTTLARDLRPLDEGEVQAQALVQRVPDSPDGHALLGYIAYERGELPQAVRHFLRALEREPNDADALFYMGISYIAAGQTELIFELPQHVRRCGSRGHGEVEEQEREHDTPEPEEEPAVQGKAGGEYLREADFLEPEPVREKARQPRNDRERDEEGGDDPQYDPPEGGRKWWQTRGRWALEW